MAAGSFDPRLAAEVEHVFSDAFVARLQGEGLNEALGAPVDSPLAALRAARAWAGVSLALDADDPDGAGGAARQAEVLYLQAYEALGRPPAVREHMARDMARTPRLARKGLEIFARHGTRRGANVPFVVAGHKMRGDPDAAVAFLDNAMAGGAGYEATLCGYTQAGAVRAALKEAMSEGLSGNEAVRAVQRRNAERGIPPLLIATLPKSGTMFLSNRLAEALVLPRFTIAVDGFPENRVVPSYLEAFAAGGALAVDHLDPAPATLDALAAAGVGRLVVHVRDPRQAVVSWLHHLRDNMTAGHFYIRYTEQPPVPEDFERRPVEEQHRHVLATYFPAAVAWIERWWQVAADDGRFAVHFTEFSAMKDDPVGTANAVLGFFGARDRVAACDMAPPTKGDLHFRAGRTDEWRDVFDSDQQASMWRRLSHLPAMAARFGWTA